jgi:hypothetical protein
MNNEREEEYFSPMNPKEKALISDAVRGMRFLLKNRVRLGTAERQFGFHSLY